LITSYTLEVLSTRIFKMKNHLLVSLSASLNGRLFFVGGL